MHWFTPRPVICLPVASLGQTRANLGSDSDALASREKLPLSTSAESFHFLV